jgi:hypothetical protein
VGKIEMRKAKKLKNWKGVSVKEVGGGSKMAF